MDTIMVIIIYFLGGFSLGHIVGTIQLRKIIKEMKEEIDWLKKKKGE